MEAKLAQRPMGQLKLTSAAQSSASGTARATGTIGQIAWVQMVPGADLMVSRKEITLLRLSTLLVDANVQPRNGVLKCSVLWMHQHATHAHAICLAALLTALENGVNGAHAKVTTCRQSKSKVVMARASAAVEAPRNGPSLCLCQRNAVVIAAQPLMVRRRKKNAALPLALLIAWVNGPSTVNAPPLAMRENRCLLSSSLSLQSMVERSANTRQTRRGARSVKSRNAKSHVSVNGCLGRNAQQNVGQMALSRATSMSLKRPSMAENNAKMLASVMSGLAIQNQCHAQLMQFVSGVNGVIAPKLAVTARTMPLASDALGRRSSQQSMVVRNARQILLRMVTVIPASVFAQRFLGAQFHALVLGRTGLCATPRKQTQASVMPRVATSAAGAPRAEHTPSRKRHSLEARSAQRKMAARIQRHVVNANAQVLVRATGLSGPLAGQLVVEAANLELSSSQSQQPMEAVNAPTSTKRQSIALAQRIAALWTVKDHGASLTSALKNARIAVATVPLELKRGPSLFLCSLNVVVKHATTKMAKWMRRPAMSTAAHRIAKDLGASSVSAPPLVVLEIARRPTPSPIRLPLVARNALGKTPANSLKHALTQHHAPSIAKVNGIRCGDIALQSVA